MALQTTYGMQRDRAMIPGMVANMEPDRRITRTAEGAVPFGAPLIRGTDPDNQCAVPAAQGDWLGVAIKDLFQRPVDDSEVTSYADVENVPIMQKGVIWVIADGAVNAGDPAFYSATGTITANATGTFAIPGGEFDSSGADGDVVKLRLK